MGAGRSETARIIFGLDPCRSGEVRVKGKQLARLSPDTAMDAGIVFLTEDRRADGLLMSAPIFDTEALPNLETHAGRAGWVNASKLYQYALDQSRRVQLNTLEIGQVLSRNLSGGNQQKVVLAKWLMRKPNVFILDEPTRGVDIGAKAEIYKIVNTLARDGCSVLMISSEMEELLGMCDRILVMHRGEITDVLKRSEFSQERILQAAMGQVRMEAAQ
jgi:ABC-type sugar transport system ATPase subunit